MCFRKEFMSRLGRRGRLKEMRVTGPTVSFQPKHLWIFPDMPTFLLYPETLSGKRKSFFPVKGVWVCKEKEKRNNANGVVSFSEVPDTRSSHMAE